MLQVSPTSLSKILLQVLCIGHHVKEVVGDLVDIVDLEVDLHGGQEPGTQSRTLKIRQPCRLSDHSTGY